MKSRFTIVEHSLKRAELRWKLLWLLELSSALGILLCLAALALGTAILRGWITHKTTAAIGFSLIGGCGFSAWLMVLFYLLKGGPDRGWLAGTVEQSDARLLDRLNTLAFLENRPSQARSESFALRIARQTHHLLTGSPSPQPFSACRPLGFLFAFILTAAVTVLFLERSAPWSRLMAAQKITSVRPRPTQQPLELALPPTNSIQSNQAWGEVRITKPGADLAVTRVDIVRLQIEAAANQALTNVGWFSTLNGGEEVTHPLAAPSEPHYALYQPALDLSSLHLTNWDVIAYFARARTDHQSSYASQLYFLEVRPFQQELMNLPGGREGKAYKTLSQLSGMIQQQQQVIRKTYQHIQRPVQTASADQRKLAETEQDIGGAAGHLKADLAAQVGDQPDAETLHRIGEAQKSLEAASTLLQTNQMQRAQGPERDALAHLVAARRLFQQSVNRQPGAFQKQSQQASSGSAEAGKSLKDMAEFRDESKAGADFVQKTLEQQRQIEQQSSEAASPDEGSRLASQEQQLRNDLNQFQGQHPQVFRKSQGASEQAQKAMASAANALAHGSSQAPEAVSNATQKLEQLNQRLQRQATADRLADAYRLKQMLDQHIQTFDHMARQDGQVSAEQGARTAGQARETINQLRSAAEEEPTRAAFGDPLREALSGERKVDLDTRLDRLEQAGQSPGQAPGDVPPAQRAAEARDALAQVSKAFEQSQPKSLQMARQSDPLKPDEKGGLTRGMAQLDSLLKQLEHNGKSSAGDRAGQAQEALANLQAGISSDSQGTDQGRQLLNQLEQTLKGGGPIDPNALQMLMNELQRFSTETSARLAKQEDQPQVTSMDPSRFPPSYRSRIQTYFQKLSEH